LANLEPGSYEIHASGGGLAGRTYAPVVVRLSDTVSGIEIALDPALTLSGRLLDDRGDPISNGEVSLTADLSGRQIRGHTRSGSDGTFQLENVEPGAAALIVRASGHVYTQREVLLRHPVAPVHLVMRRAARLQGTVLGVDGRPLAQALVFAVGNPGEPNSVEIARTADDGGFDLDTLPPSTIRPIVEHATEGYLFAESLTLRTAESRTITLRFRGGHRIQGRVQWPDGSPAAGIVVRASAGFWSGCSLSEAQGYYNLGPFEKGTTWSVSPETTGSAEIAAEEVSIEDRDIIGVDFTVPGSDLQITGRVTDARGTAIPGAFVWVSPSPAGGRVLSANDGSFVIDALTAGHFRLRAEAPGAPPTEATVTEAGTRDLQLVVPDGGILAGKVGEVTGQPVACAVVDVLYVTGAGRRRLVTSVSVSNPSGAFEIRALSPGSYDLEVASADGLVGVLAGVSLAPGQAQRSLWVALSPGVRVIGRLLAADTDTPIVGASVVADGPVRPLPGTIDVTGTFGVAGLLPGTRVPLVFQAEGFERQRLSVGSDRAQVVDVGTVRLARGTDDKHGRIGVVIDVREDGSVLVEEVVAGMPAAGAGLQPGDVITHVGEQILRDTDHLGVHDLLRGAPGSTVNLQIRRGQERRTLSVGRI
jgi:hypothetical protein